MYNIYIHICINIYIYIYIYIYICAASPLHLHPWDVLLLHELRFEDAACLRDAILQLQNQQKESGARTQSHNLACLSAAPACHRASAGLPQVKCLSVCLSVSSSLVGRKSPYLPPSLPACTYVRCYFMYDHLTPPPPCICFLQVPGAIRSVGVRRALASTRLTRLYHSPV
jgi:hypothetical protein